MGDYLAALTATIVFTGLFSFFLVYMDIDSVKQNWDKRRCELPVMITAALYKPKEVSQSSTEFATDNFNYCSRKIANEVIRLGMAPYYVIAGQQVSAQNSMGGPMNNIRGAIAKTRNEFSKYLNYPIQIKFDKTKPDGTKRKLLDISVAKRYGWSPKVSLKSGFFKTIKYLDF